ncbi:hypothetical protein NC981_13010 [Leptolyngbya sp. DQ-M1]|uniref:hypothetical protein n=1 Tax=Leptolyngbya sp. DQ-M1 TaxID=2933920 RepID=UPI00329787A5
MQADELKQLVKESLREVLREERLKLCQVLIPVVSDKEMQEIQQKLGTPADLDDSELVNMSDWVRHGTKLH